ncbi:hypothetical protein A2U01_0077647, partial [Trifolium medium]|nr:hypothetical protein [Trifolium medium]
SMVVVGVDDGVFRSRSVVLVVWCGNRQGQGVENTGVGVVFRSGLW